MDLNTKLAATNLKLVTQRDELLAALEALEASFEPDAEREHYKPHRSDHPARVAARAAIARARGTNTTQEDK